MLKDHSSEPKNVLDKIPNQLNQIIKIQSRLVGTNFDLNAFINLVVSEMEHLTPATGVVVELVDDDSMVYRAASGTVSAHVGLRLPRANSISGLCVASREILRSDDTEKDNRVNLEAARKVGARSLVVAPLFHQGKTIGVLKILSKFPTAFTEADVQTLQLMAGFIGSAIAHQIFFEENQKLLAEKTRMLQELEEAQEKLKYMAEYDHLTDLPNRHLFTRRLNELLAEAERSHQLVTLMFLDVDHFKTINDTYGHNIGDELLKAFAARLKKCVRAYDTIARLGGDEFIILLKNLPHREEAAIIANKIIDTIKKEFKFSTQTLNITTSIGIAFAKETYPTSDEILKCADLALYEAKAAGRNKLKVFSS